MIFYDLINSGKYRRVTDYILAFENIKPQTSSSYSLRLLKSNKEEISDFLRTKDKVARSILYDFKSQFRKYSNSKIIHQKVVEDYIDLLSLNLKHVFQHNFLYTNGKEVCTLIIKEDNHQIVKHKKSSQFLECFEGIPSSSLQLDEYFVTDSLGKAEDIIKELLSLPSINTYTTFRKEEKEEITFQNFIHPHYLIHFREKTFIKKVKDYTESAPLFFLTQELPKEIDGFQIKTCATCQNFGQSGMSTDMSGGTGGYCMLESNSNKSTWDSIKRQNAHLVSAFELCEHYSFADIKEN